MAYTELGSAPYDEDCAQVGHPDYTTRAREECAKYIALLNEKFPNLPEGMRFYRKGFQHDFGTYYEVVIGFDDNNETHYNFVSKVENNLPATWSCPVD